MYTEIKDYIGSLNQERILKERQNVLIPLVNYLQEKINAKEQININCICTHNSRRSHLTQIWIQVMASFYGIKELTAYSAGTESTALYPTVSKVLKKSGLKISKLSETANPVYAIRFDETSLPIIGFSKRLDHPFNPAEGFVAIMTCDAANEACPLVPGAEERIPITYQDPKAFDDRPEEVEKYHERMKQIATEMKFIFSKLNP